MATYIFLTITSFCSYVLRLGSLKEMPEFTSEVKKYHGPYRLFVEIWQKPGMFIYFSIIRHLTTPTPSYFVVSSVISGISSCTSLATSYLVSFFLKISPTLQHLVCLLHTG